MTFDFVFAAPCRFRGERTGEKVVRLSEATPIGTEAFRVLAFPRRNFNIQALDGVRICILYFLFHHKLHHRGVLSVPFPFKFPFYLHFNLVS